MLNKGEILYYTFVLSAMRNLTAIYINKTVVTCTDDPNNRWECWIVYITYLQMQT